MRWGPAKPRTRIKVTECGRGHWEERDHRLDIPHGIDTFDFKVTWTGHERLERIFLDCCAERRTYAAALGDKPEEQRIARWICLHRLFVRPVDTKVRATVIGFEREEARRRIPT